MNEYDSDYLAQLLQSSGYSPVEEPDNADLIFINTCTVRAKPVQKAYSLLGRMRALKKKKPSLIIGMLGCIAQQEGADLIKRFPELDLVLGTREVGRVEEFIKKIEIDRERVVATELRKGPRPFVGKNGYHSGRVKSYVSIMEGCNNFCSFCIVPYVRGREVSRSPQQILEESRYLVAQGVKEITLLGQNVNSYYWEKDDGMDFPGLLRGLNRISGLQRMRFTTSHPKDLSEELIACFGELKKLCPHIHLPVQSGSDRILKRMNRAYTRKKYLKLVDKLRAVRPGIAITSDLIVGFPGETEEDFQMTIDLMEKIRFDNAFSFKYSDRPGTRAAKMGGKVPESEKGVRLTRLQEFQRQITLEKNRALMGREVEVLVEGTSKKGGLMTGRTGSNKIVNFLSDNSKIGLLVNVLIENVLSNSLRGELVRETASQRV
jgi:tRNA-2-methylthio-N6-dimethylallyladenosine synthase